MPPREGIYGIIAEFNTPSPSWCIRHRDSARAAGYRRMECYTPYPVEEVGGSVALSHHQGTA